MARSWQQVWLWIETKMSENRKGTTDRNWMRNLLASVGTHVEKRFFRVVAALVKRVAREFGQTGVALELDDARKEFPKEVSPGDFLRAQTQDKLVEFERLIRDVRCRQLAVRVYENLTLVTKLPAPLICSEEGPAVGTSLQHVLLVLKQNFELLHENLALQLVFFVHQVLQHFDFHFSSEALHETRVHAVHVDRQLQDLLQVLASVVETLIDKSRHLKEVAGDEDRDSGLDFHRRLETVHVFHEPVENLDVAVDGDVDVVERLLVRQILLEVLHRRKQKRLVTAEVLSLFFRLVTHVNQHLVSGDVRPVFRSGRTRLQLLLARRADTLIGKCGLRL